MGIQELVLPELPAMLWVRQRYQIPPAVDIGVCLEREWSRLGSDLGIKPGARVAVAVGSRGIANLVEVVGAVVRKLKDAGCKPFVTPAMGSHGGATAEGQKEVLKARGITEQSVGAPVEATMDVVPLGEKNGIPLFVDRLAH